MHTFRTLIATVDLLDLDDDVAGLTLLGAGITLMARVDPVTAKRVAGVIESASPPAEQDGAIDPRRDC